MGCGASHPATTYKEARASGGGAGAGGREQDPVVVEDHPEYVEELLAGAQKQLVNMSSFINSETPPTLPDKLLKASACASVFSAVGGHFQFLVDEARDGVGVMNNPTVILSPASMNFSTRCLTAINNVSKVIATFKAGAQNENESIHEQQAKHVGGLVGLWKKMANASALSTIRHPALGPVPVLMPVLSVCLLHRSMGMNADPDAGEVVDPAVRLLVEGGADLNTVSSHGLGPLHVCLASMFKVAEDMKDGDEERGGEKWAALLATTRLLLEHGADPTVVVTPMARGPRGDVSLHHDYHMRLWAGVLEGREAPANCIDMARRLASAEGAASAGGADMARGLQPLAREVLELEGHVGGAPTHADIVLRGKTGAGGAAPPAMEMASLGMYRILWATSLLTRDQGNKREKYLDLARSSPFSLAPCYLLCAQHLQEAGGIPRYDTKDEGSTFRPTRLEDVSSDAFVVFVSHRWLRDGAPDNHEGTKYRQILNMSEHVAARRGLALGSIYLWLDYSCVDQSDPMPVIEALPLYIALCDGFAWVQHPQYMERAWCLTEQYIHWRVNVASSKYRMGPDGLEEEQLHPDRPPCLSPALGRLWDEGDRVALATMMGLYAAE